MRAFLLPAGLVMLTRMCPDRPTDRRAGERRPGQAIDRHLDGRPALRRLRAIRTELSCVLTMHTFEERTEYLGTGGGIFTSLGTYLFISDSTLVLERPADSGSGTRWMATGCGCWTRRVAGSPGDLADHYFGAGNGCDRPGCRHSVNIALVRTRCCAAWTSWPRATNQAGGRRWTWRRGSPSAGWGR